MVETFHGPFLMKHMLKNRKYPNLIKLILINKKFNNFCVTLSRWICGLEINKTIFMDNAIFIFCICYDKNEVVPNQTGLFSVLANLIGPVKNSASQ